MNILKLYFLPFGFEKLKNLTFWYYFFLFFIYQFFGQKNFEGLISFPGSTLIVSPPQGGGERLEYTRLLWPNKNFSLPSDDYV